MDLSRVKLIRDSSVEQLSDVKYVEELITRLGYNTEVLNEQPTFVINNGGGLRIWQYPNQFSKYLMLLKDKGIKSYMEIGCRWGGTFVLSCEYLSKFNKIEKAIAIDLIESPVKEYCDSISNYSFKQINSQTSEFNNYIKENGYFDIIFIDGDHSYQGVKNDYLAVKDAGRIFVFHDIDSAIVPGVGQFWRELKTAENSTFDFYEFTEQYDEVLTRMGGRHYLGIGVAIRK
jgi:cephalosporin hydroxylase